jgi:hypothetical protein
MARRHRYSQQLDAATRRRGKRIAKMRIAAYKRKERTEHPKTVSRRTARKR